MAEAGGSLLASWLGPRAVLAGTLPLAVAVAPPGWLLLAGAPSEIDPAAVSGTLGSLELVEVVVGLLAVVVATVATQPLLGIQLGIWTSAPPAWFPPARWARARHQDRARRLWDRAKGSGAPQEKARAAQVLRCGYAYPGRGQLAPTALGNALLAASGRGGQRYGLDGVLLWPRLYPLLTPEVRGLVDDRRLVLDVIVALVPAWSIAAVGWLVLSASAGSWLALLAVVPAVAAYLSYRGAISRAEAFGEAVEVAFDLCRFSLYQALHLPVPADPRAELVLAEQVNRWLGRDRWTGGGYAQ